MEGALSMMMRKGSAWVIAGAIALSGAWAGSAQGQTGVPMVPPGITLIEVVRELPSSSDDVLWFRPGDAEGRTFLVSDADQAGVSNCQGGCAEEFAPLLAPAGAQPLGDWSLVRRSDGRSQWAYQSRPLY